MSKMITGMVEGGGGILNDVNAEILDAKFIMWDYRGRTEYPKTPALMIKYKDESKPVGDPHIESEQAYTVGAAERFAITDDGKSIEPVAPATGITKTSNCGILFTSLLDSGLDPGVIDEDISGLIGLRVHLISFAPKRAGFDQKNEKGYDKTLPIVDAILSTGVAAEPTPDVDAEVTEAVNAILAANPEVSKAQIATKIAGIPGMATNPNLQAIMKRATDDQFLNAGTTWAFGSGVLKKK